MLTLVIALISCPGVIVASLLNHSRDGRVLRELARRAF